MRKRYFIKSHDRISGPYTTEDLSTKGIVDGTQVWNEEAFDWCDASTFVELRALLDRPRPRPKRKFLNWFRGRTTS